MSVDSSILVWNVYERTDAGYVQIGSGVAQSVQERLDILDPVNFKPIVSMALPRAFMVPNGVRMVGYLPHQTGPLSDRKVEWLLTIPEVEDADDRSQD